MAAALLAGCATSPPAPTAAAGWPDDRLSGRIAIRVDARPPRALSGDFTLRGNAETGELTLDGPLGSRVAEARWSPGLAQLQTQDRSQRQYTGLDALTQDLLGETLPIGALFDWLRARPWPGAPSEPSVPGPGFTQLGWTVDLAGAADGLIVARRPGSPAVDVRARLER